MTYQTLVLILSTVLGYVISLGIERKAGIMKVIYSPKFPRVLHKPNVKRVGKKDLSFKHFTELE